MTAQGVIGGECFLCGARENLTSARAAGQYVRVCRPCEAARHRSAHDPDGRAERFDLAADLGTWSFLPEGQMCEFCEQSTAVGTLFRDRFRPICAACARANGVL